MVVIVLMVSTSVCGTESVGSSPTYHPKITIWCKWKHTPNAGTGDDQNNSLKWVKGFGVRISIS